MLSAFATRERLYGCAKRTISAVAGVALVLLGSTSSALADWSAPKSIALPGPVAVEAVAVDARGDAAVAWATMPPPPSFSFGTTIHLVVRLANGRLIKRVLWSNRQDRPEGVSVALSHGEVTVAWVAATPAEWQRGDLGATVRAAYGPLVGRWASPRAIGHWYDRFPPEGRYPRLASAPDGEVLLAFDDDSPAIDGPAVAWRRPGHRFDRPQRLFGRARIGLRVAHELGPMPAFDTHGRAYVWGKCDGIVLSAPPHSHRFGRAVVVARPPVSNFTLSLVGPAQGLAAWVRGGCTTAMEEGPNQPGPVLASILRRGAFGRPLVLTSPATQALSSNAVAQPGGGGTVSWSPYVLPPANTTSSIRVAANGTLGPVLSGPQIPSGLVPATIDGAGDQILASAYWSAFPPGLQGGVVVRPVGGGADQPAPAPYGGLAAAPTGRAFALAWNTNPSTFALSVWRP